MILSYVVAATAALLSALCYAEMAVSLPIAGGAFNYISISFGELAAWLVAWNMCLETTLSSAAVARGFASYLATLVGLQPSALRLAVGPIQFDPAAALLILLLTALLIKGTRESSMFNMGAPATSSWVWKYPAKQPCLHPSKPADSLPDFTHPTLACLPAGLPSPPACCAVVSALNVASILLVLCAGFPQAQPANLAPFAPYGAQGVFSAAAVVFFSYVGFDYGEQKAEALLASAQLLYILAAAAAAPHQLLPLPLPDLQPPCPPTCLLARLPACSGQCGGGGSRPCRPPAPGHCGFSGHCHSALPAHGPVHCNDGAVWLH